jgi:hypothetical protein
VASALVIAASAGAGRAAAATLTVCPRGCPYTQIAPALAAARSGDTIKIATGTYTGGIAIDLNVKLVGAGAGATIINGGGPVVTVGSFGAQREPEVLIDGVTITGGVARSSPESIPFAGQDGVFALGGGIEIPQNADGTGGATVTITNSAITDNSAEPSTALSSGFAFAGGGGIDNWGTLRLSNTTVNNNHVFGHLASDVNGAGILNWTHLTLTSSIVSANHAIATGPSACSAGGGGIESSGTLELTAARVIDNTVTELASASSCGEAQGGGIFVHDGGSATINDAIVSQNRVTATSVVGDATAFSGAIADYGQLTLTHSTVDANQVSAATTAALGTANPTSGGIGISFGGGARIADTHLTANRVDATAPNGTAIAEAGAIQTTDTTLSDSLVSDNRLTASSQTGTATVHGAGVQHGNGQLEIRNTNISDNTGDAQGPQGQALGGGIWNDAFFPPPPDPQLTLEDTTITRNALTASPGITVHGGGLFTTFPVTLLDSTIRHNTPEDCFGQIC